MRKWDGYLCCNYSNIMVDTEAVLKVVRNVEVWA